MRGCAKGLPFALPFISFRASSDASTEMGGSALLLEV